jgi:hypothetical protein
MNTKLKAVLLGITKTKGGKLTSKVIASGLPSELKKKLRKFQADGELPKGIDAVQVWESNKGMTRALSSKQVAARVARVEALEGEKPVVEAIEPAEPVKDDESDVELIEGLDL